MSNHSNHRRGEEKRTEHGPTWENPNPGKGCNSTHVARCRSFWKKLKNRTLRRTGKVSHKYRAINSVIPMVPEVSDVEENSDVAAM